jgi:hypothetical protein
MNGNVKAITIERLRLLGFSDQSPCRLDPTFTYGYGHDCIEISHCLKDTYHPDWGREWVIERMWQGKDRTRGMVESTWVVNVEIANLNRHIGHKEAKEEFHKKISKWMDGVLK